MSQSLSNVIVHLVFSTKDIQEQEKHHRKKDFKTEFREFLERHEIEYDERYVWD